VALQSERRPLPLFLPLPESLRSKRRWWPSFDAEAESEAIALGARALAVALGAGAFFCTSACTRPSRALALGLVGRTRNFGSCTRGPQCLKDSIFSHRAPGGADQSLANNFRQGVPHLVWGHGGGLDLSPGGFDGLVVVGLGAMVAVSALTRAGAPFRRATTAREFPINRVFPVWVSTSMSSAWGSPAKLDSRLSYWPSHLRPFLVCLFTPLRQPLPLWVNAFSHPRGSARGDFPPGLGGSQIAPLALLRSSTTLLCHPCTPCLDGNHWPHLPGRSIRPAPASRSFAALAIPCPRLRNAWVCWGLASYPLRG